MGPIQEKGKGGNEAATVNCKFNLFGSANLSLDSLSRPIIKPLLRLIRRIYVMISRAVPLLHYYQHLFLVRTPERHRRCIITNYSTKYSRCCHKLWSGSLWSNLKQKCAKLPVLSSRLYYYFNMFQLTYLKWLQFKCKNGLVCLQSSSIEQMTHGLASVQIQYFMLPAPPLHGKWSWTQRCTFFQLIFTFFA